MIQNIQKKDIAYNHTPEASSHPAQKLEKIVVLPKKKYAQDLSPYILSLAERSETFLEAADITLGQNDSPSPIVRRIAAFILLGIVVTIGVIVMMVLHQILAAVAGLFL